MARPCWHCKLTKNIYSRTHITNAYLYCILYMYTSNCKIDSQFNTQIAYHLCLRLHCIRVTQLAYIVLVKSFNIFLRSNFTYNLIIVINGLKNKCDRIFIIPSVSSHIFLLIENQLSIIFFYKIIINKIIKLIHMYENNSLHHSKSILFLSVNRLK